MRTLEVAVGDSVGQFEGRRICGLLGDALVVFESGDEADIRVQRPEQDNSLLVNIR